MATMQEMFGTVSFESAMDNFLEAGYTTQSAYDHAVTVSGQSADNLCDRETCGCLYSDGDDDFSGSYAEYPVAVSICGIGTNDHMFEYTIMDEYGCVWCGLIR